MKGAAAIFALVSSAVISIGSVWHREQRNPFLFDKGIVYLEVISLRLV